MSELKITPGEWLCTADAFDRVTARDPERHTAVLITRLPRSTDARGDETAVQLERWTADGHLIAAAPDLYAALDELVYMIEAWEKAVRQVIETDPSHGMNLEKAKSALAKARGETE